jgi:hypothetical protein
MNPVALVDAFADGVGGVWVPARGKPAADLAAALQPHVAKAPPGSALALCRALGARWRSYCLDAPESAWKAAEWLARGAPASDAPRDSTTLSISEERRIKAEARKAQERYAERERERAPPPKEFLELAAKIGKGGG